MNKWVQELVTILDKDFILTYQNTTLYINKNNNLTFIIDNQEYIGSKVINMGLQATNYVHVVITKSLKGITLFINRAEVFSIFNNQIIISQNTITLTEKTKQTINVIVNDLTQWVELRKTKFKIKTSTSNDYEIITIEDQKQQLSEIRDSLIDLIKLTNNGKTHHIEHILATLRSLIYYKNKSNYDPLLFRLASYQVLALPVYVHQTFPENKQNSSLSILNNATSTPSDLNTKMIDFQEYLEENSLILDSKQLSLLDFIGSAATTRSSAHFDQRVPKTITSLDNASIFYNIKIFDRLVINLAILTIDMAKIILNKFSTIKTER